MGVRFWKSIFWFSRVQNPNTRPSNFSAEQPFGLCALALLHSEAISRALKWCKETQSLNNGCAVHAQLITHGLIPDAYIASGLISMYSAFMSYDDAAKVFDEMPERNVASWTAMISSYSHCGNPSKALRIFMCMLEWGLEEPNCYTFSAALKACAMAGDLCIGTWVHKHIQNVHLQFDTTLTNAVLDMYVKCDSLIEARKVFDSKFPLNSVSWNTMISGYCNAGKMTEAEHLFCRIPVADTVSFNTMVSGFAKNENPKALCYVMLMHKHGLKLDLFTLPCALKTCGSRWESGMGKQLHSYIVRSGWEGGLHIQSSLIDMYGDCGHVELSVNVFDECSIFKCSAADKLLHLNSMLSAFCNNGFDQYALCLISKICSSEFKLDAFSLSIAIKACINLKVIGIGLQVHALILTMGYHVDHVVGSILVELYAKYGELEDAVKTFLSLPHKDLVAWTGLITSCVQKGMNQLAFTLFKDMRRLKCKLDHFVLSIILKSCADLPCLRSGEQIHALCIKGGFEIECGIITSLVDVYSKCGDIENALRLFKASTWRDVVCWTGIIVGCGNNGRTDEAIQLFHWMLESGEKPNEITFLGLLSACRHAGLFSDAAAFFKSMEQKHGLKPSLEHHCCMVDILGRAGLFEEAIRLISGMPYEPDDKIWNSLLGASVMNQSVTMANLALNHLHQFVRKESSNFVSPSSVYNSQLNLREIVRSVSMMELGRSWTEARNLSYFAASTRIVCFHAFNSENRDLE